MVRVRGYFIMKRTFAAMMMEKAVLISQDPYPQTSLAI